MRRMLLVALLVLLASTASAQQSAVMGTWLTASGKAQVRIAPCPDPKTGPICGIIVGLIEPRGPDGTVVAPDVATDWRNTDPALRGRKVLGMPLIWGFKKTSKPNEFEEGQIYNGENGKTYNANISLQPDASCACAAMSARRCSAKRKLGLA